ncbi:uncharacterized protein DSM5745_05721 [Aspergillus mulundensis]|uniref:Uncharacterized protein n=1 Tax=Aspergillus mulundensis TaxID=1810919 RepID=A0A3D8RXT0_9EURO|nr:hypothetical protein DSM5745_05721 [Aspergillus mulundensis]RDW78869.1 hypothetical protein DSM5745_05721 [Aspergillus mulundensis]
MFDCLPVVSVGKRDVPDEDGPASQCDPLLTSTAPTGSATNGDPHDALPTTEGVKKRQTMAFEPVDRWRYSYRFTEHSNGYGHVEERPKTKAKAATQKATAPTSRTDGKTECGGEKKQLGGDDNGSDSEGERTRSQKVGESDAGSVRAALLTINEIWDASCETQRAEMIGRIEKLLKVAGPVEISADQYDGVDKVVKSWARYSNTPPPAVSRFKKKLRIGFWSA